MGIISVALLVRRNGIFTPSYASEFVDDVALATAVLDRLSFRCETFSMSGNSYRLENRERFFTGEV